MSDRNETFHYTYSAAQQQEIQKIREKYIPKEQDKMEQLRRLDESVTKQGTIVAITVGMISTLVMGVGMCCTMVWGETLFIPGVVIGMIGIAGDIAAYPLYTHIIRKRREKIAPEIIRLTEELSKN